MKNIFKHLKFSTKKNKLSVLYVLSAVIVLSALSFIMINFNVPLFIVIFVCWTLGCAVLVMSFFFIPKNFSLSKKEMMKYALGRIFYNVFVYICIMAAASFGLNFVTSSVIFTIFARSGEKGIAIGVILNQILLYILSVSIFSKVTIYNGFIDTTHKRYNPHIILHSVLFSYAFIFPFLCSEFMIGNSMLSLSQFFLTQIVLDLNLGITMFFAGFAILTAMTCIIILYYYSEGRRNFFVKHPHDLEYDKKEIDEFIQNN